MREGASEVEVYIEDRVEKSVIIEEDEIHSEREKSEATMGVRAFLDKNRGFAAVTLPYQGKIYHSVLKSAQIQESDPGWEGLPHPQNISPVDTICDPRIRDISMDTLLEMSTAVSSPVPSIMVNSARLTAITSTMYITNSQGMSQQYEATKCYIFISCLHTGGEIPAMMDYAVSRQLDIPIDTLMEESCNLITDAVQARTLQESFTGEVLFSASVVNQVFMNALAAAVNAENVRRGVSVFRDHLNAPVASERLSVVDNGRLPGGVCSAPFDREGTSCQKTELITDGILQNLIHDAYTAHFFDTHSTGNAVGSAVVEPHVGISNCLIQPGDTSLDEMLASMKKGLYVPGLSGGTDVTTGSFSGVVPHGYYVEQGELVYPTQALISGNCFSALSAVEMVGSEQKANLEGMYGVPLLIDGMTIISR